MLHMNMTPRMTQSLQMTLAPRMIQSMEILQKPIMELQEYIQQELQENPVLELKEPGIEDFDAPEGVDPLSTERDFNPDGVLTHDNDAQNDFTRLDEINRDWDNHFDEDHRSSRGNRDELSDKKHEAMQNAPSRPVSLHDALTEQLHFLDLSAEQFEMALFLISHIDERGFLGAKLEELVPTYPHPTSLDEMEEVLLQLQRLDPPGIAARDLRECLLLQLTPDMEHYDLLRQLILHHLEDIQHNRMPIIQKKTGAAITAIKDAIDILRTLNPKPGAAFAVVNTHYVVPDVIVERRDDGEFDVRLTEDWVPNIRISKRYMELFQNRESDPKAREYLQRKITSAKWLLDSIEQRRDTLEKVTRAIIRHQRKFFDLGPDHIEPLKMQQIADVVGVHVTTVSRAVDDKWVQTPRGVFALKRFFGGGAVNTLTGEDVAWETIKQKLLDLIDKEDKSNPLSDEDLMKKLQEQGFPVKRRTVTKYRDMLSIPSSRQRKDWIRGK